MLKRTACSLVALGLLVFLARGAHGDTIPINHPPTADANGPYTIAVGDSLILDGSGSYDINAVDGDFIVSWDWSLNQANPSIFDGIITGQTPSVTSAVLASYGLDTPGIYHVGLRVTDTHGKTDVDFTSLILQDPVPEPATIVLVGLGIGGFFAARRRRSVC